MSLNKNNANNKVNFQDFLKDFNSLRLEDDNDIWNKVAAKDYIAYFKCMDCKYETDSYEDRLTHKMKFDHKFDT